MRRTHLFDEVTGSDVDENVLSVLYPAGNVEGARERDEDLLFCVW